MMIWFGAQNKIQPLVALVNLRAIAGAGIGAWKPYAGKPPHSIASLCGQWPLSPSAISRFHFFQAFLLAAPRTCTDAKKHEAGPVGRPHAR